MNRLLNVLFIRIMCVMNIDKFFDNRRHQFWTLQFLGWSAWGLNFYLVVNIWGKPGLYEQYLPLAATMGMVISLGLRQVYLYTWNYPPRRLLIVGFFASLAAGVLWYEGRSTLFGHLLSHTKKYPMEFEGWDLFFSQLPNYVSATTVMLCWSGLYFGIKYYQLLLVERERGLKSETMAHEAQLKMLRYQLNPHFLFNTLNAISTLILDKENKLANTMVTRLSHFLRYSLDNDPMQKVTLSQEVEALKLYLDIEKVRFDERLQIHFEIEPAASSALVPSLLLQPLVENAIKYAIAQSINGGSIKIAARTFAGELLLEVIDDGPGMSTPNGRSSGRRGVGIENTRERLLELYGSKQSFGLGTTDPHGLTIHIRIPLETEQTD
jgi:two-component system LytT family sensor kinase